ncbi:glycosyltransferase family 8 protein [Micromonospora coxensis]|uniref:glycosyltransferase family 8 protein n=1 Tax=Micromonospora coxensis TaxID=356852 RepID=UPI000B5ABFAC|nr:glycosyltransferase family 8 protein [Micromonospora coxensis]
MTAIVLRIEVVVLDFALAFDATYAPHAAVVMSSVAAQTPGPLRFWLVAGDDVAERTRVGLARAAGPDATVCFLTVDPPQMRLPGSRNPDLSYLSPAMYLRLLIPPALPPEVDRLLYLDSDVLCTGSLAQLRDVDLAGTPVGAVRDAFTRRLIDAGGLPGIYQSRDLDAQAPYLNSGVLLIDVPRWKELDVTGKALDYVARHAHESRFPDQDALNYAVYGNWTRLSKRWNHMMAWRLDPGIGGNLTDAAILHFAGPVKPWQPSFPMGAHRQLYWSHRRRTDPAGIRRR